MEVFNGVRFVRLRSCERRDKYLAADTNGVLVCITGQRAVHNTVWAVDHAHGPAGPCVMLRGAYGRYLFTTDVNAGIGPSSSVVVTQEDLDQEDPPPGMLWQVMRRRDSFVVRSGTGHYLRANGRHLTFIREATASLDNGSTMMQWLIENVPVSMARPNILEPTRQLTHRRRPPVNEREVTRLIRFVRCEMNGNINEAAWRTYESRTHNLLQLRLTLASSLGGQGPSRHVTRITPCIRAGRYGRFTPLLVDLPIGNNRIDVVIVTHETPVDNNLRYPDVTAP